MFRTFRNLTAFALILMCLVPDALAGRDFYKIMGLQKNATAAEIKKAYRKLSLQYHPDKNPGDEAALKMFQDINSANEVLSDADKRRKYDQGGEEALNQPEVRDPFADLFGFGQQQEQTGPGISVKIKLSLEELYEGKSLTIQYNRKIICPHCRGSGAERPEDVKTCQKCNGQGVIIQKQQIAPGFVQQFQTQCDKCGGQGKTVTSTCHQCRSSKLVDSVDSLSIFIEKGAPDGHEVTYKDAADEYINVRAGAVVFKVTQLPHSKFERKGNDLKTRIHISLKEALLGFTREITHLDGHIVNVDRTDRVTKPGLMERFKGEGMPVFEHYGDFGDLLVTYIVDMPTSLSFDQTVLFKQFFWSSS